MLHHTVHWRAVRQPAGAGAIPAHRQMPGIGMTHAAGLLIGMTVLMVSMSPVLHSGHGWHAGSILMRVPVLGRGGTRACQKGYQQKMFHEHIGWVHDTCSA